MTSLKIKIFSFFNKVKQTFSLFLFSKSAGRVNQIDIDKKLIYSLSPRKIPSSGQLKYLKKFLNPKENLVIKICLLILLANLVYLGIVGYKRYVISLPAKGGTYSEAIVGYPKTINPLYAVSRDIDNDLSRLIYSSLFSYNDQGVLITDLVDSYQLSEDFKEYTIAIKPDVKWHNGENLTTDDIIFTVRLLQDENYRSPLRLELSIASVEKVDDYTVKFVLSEPYAPFLEILTFGILPKSIWENIGSEAAALTELNLKPIGSGPYKFKSLIKNKNGDLKEYNLEVNDLYYQEPPYIKSLNFKFFAEQSEAIRSFNNGQVDGLSVLPFSWRQQLIFKDSISVSELLRPQLVGIFFNTNNNKNLEKKENRQALAQAVNKELIVNDVFFGAYKVADSPILKTNFAYHPNLEAFNYNLEAAKELITDAFDLKLTVIDVNGNLRVAEKIKSDWQELGLNIELVIISLEQAAEVIKARNFEALFYGQLVGGDPDIYAFWHSSQVGERGLNISNYQNEEVDKLLLESRGGLAFEDRLNNYYRFQEIITEDVPVIFLYTPTYTYVQSKKLKGFNGQAIIEPADRFSNISSWYIKTKKTLAK